MSGRSPAAAGAAGLTRAGRVLHASARQARVARSSRPAPLKLRPHRVGDRLRDPLAARDRRLGLARSARTSPLMRGGGARRPGPAVLRQDLPGAHAHCGLVWGVQLAPLAGGRRPSESSSGAGLGGGGFCSPGGYGRLMTVPVRPLPDRPASGPPQCRGMRSRCRAVGTVRLCRRRPSPWKAWREPGEDNVGG